MKQEDNDCTRLSNIEIRGLLLYENILKLTQNIFGKEAMTEAVIIKAIEAGSYGVWRGIMGSKFGENDNDGNPFRTEKTRR